MAETIRSHNIVTTDPGIDDAAALLYLSRTSLDSPTAVVSSFGNVSERQAYRNIARLNRAFGFGDQWMLVRGPNRPLDSRYIKYADKAIYKGNGPDGLWNTAVSEVLDEDITESQIRVGALGQLEPGEVDHIYSFAPLTGPVLLARKGVKAKQVLIMGGAFKEGNVRPLDMNGEYADGKPRVAEWNIFKDPQAASEYFSVHAGDHVTLVPKDICMDALFTAELILKGDYKQTPENKFMKRLMSGWSTEYPKINPVVAKRGLMLADLFAVVLSDQKDMAQWDEHGIEVVNELGPDLGRTYINDSYPRVKIAVGVTNHKKLFEAMCEAAFGTRNPLK